jgi:hypothetical protein
MRLKDRDLRLLQRERPVYRIKDKSGKVFRVPLFVTPALVVLIDEKYAKDKEDELKRGMQAILEIFKREYPEIDQEWVAENIDLSLYNQIISDVVHLSCTCIENIDEMRDAKKNTKTKKKTMLKEAKKILKAILKKSKAENIL